MNTRITNKQLAIQLKTLANLLNMETSRDDAEKAGKTEFLTLDHSGVYGGWAIVTIHLPEWSEHCPFGDARKPASQMFDKLKDIISGVYAAQKIAVGETV